MPTTPRHDRPTVTIGFQGGASAQYEQAGITSQNGFVAYALVDENGLTLQTDQLPFVNNFDNTANVWPLSQVSCTILVVRP